MDLNFQLRKGSPPLPARICAYKTGPPSSNLTRTARSPHTGSRKSPPAAARLISRHRFGSCRNLGRNLTINIEHALNHVASVKEGSHTLFSSGAEIFAQLL